MKSLLLLVLLLWVTPILAQVETEFKGEIRTRYDYSEIKDHAANSRLRNGFTIGVRIKADGMFEIVSLIATGRDYGGLVEDFYSFTTDTFAYHPHINLRQLYLEKKFGENVVAQIGALDPGEGIGNLTGFNPIGWVDGGRIKIQTNLGAIAVTLGSVNDLLTPDAFNRDRDLNYFEIKVSEDFFDNLVKAEIGYEKWREHDFIKSAIKYDLKLATSKILELMAEALVDVHSGSIITSAGVTSDLLYLLTGDFQNRLKVTLAYTYVSGELVDRLNLSKKDFLRTGHGAWIKVSGDISAKYKLSWAAEARISEEKEFRVFVSKKL